MADFAETADIVNSWRPLTTEETTRAEYWLEVASRRVRRRWPDTDARIGASTLDPKDVRDVVVALVVEVLGGPPVPRARSWQVSSGSESRAITLSTGTASDPAVFEPWMVEIFEGVSTPPGPVGCFPAPGDYDRLFSSWKEA